MNLATFLHSQKQYKDSVLALPLAPLYTLPHHKWYFSSANLTPLRKRRENTSLFKYLQELQILSEKAEKNSNENFHQDDRQILGIHEKNCYFQNKMKHLFETIYGQISKSHQDKYRIKCECNQVIEDDSPSYFFTNAETMNQCLSVSKKQPKNEAISNQEQRINWYEFTKNLISSQLNKQTYSLNEQALSLYKLPQGKGNSPFIFNVLWNDNYLIFNNGNKLEVNQNMKAKAVELCQEIHKKLQAHIWAKMQSYIPKIAEQVQDHEAFIAKLEKKSKISTFRVWFYKKETNNEIYILSLSHITFKGADCIIYKDFNIKSPCPPQEIKEEETNKERSSYLTELSTSYENKTKAFSVSSKSHKVLRALTNPTEMERLKNLLDCSHLDLVPFKPNEIVIKEEEVTDIQCSCCRNLITSKEVINEVTANHIQEIRYLRQIKIGKIENSPYDFVKVCTLCYNAYMQFFKRKSAENKNQKKSIHRSQTSKNSHSFFDKATNQDPRGKVPTQSSKRLLFAKQSKQRARSELNNSKQRNSLPKEEKLIAKDRSISMKPPLYRPTKKKIRTTNTTVTENTLFHRQEFPQLNTSKAHTQQEYTSLFNPHSIKIKPPLPNKTHNLINKIISSSLQAKQSTRHQQPNDQPDLKSVNAKIIMNAIEEYQKIQRFSFKKLITKNHRSYLIKQTPQNAVPWKKSTRAYFLN